MYAWKRRLSRNCILLNVCARFVQNKSSVCYAIAENDIIEELECSERLRKERNVTCLASSEWKNFMLTEVLAGWYMTA